MQVLLYLIWLYGVSSECIMMGMRKEKIADIIRKDWIIETNWWVIINAKIFKAIDLSIKLGKVQ